MRIAPQDEKAPRGKLEVTITNWDIRRPDVFKIRLTKIESSMPSENSRTEGLGYAIKGQFLQENIPVGKYAVEIGFADKVYYVRSKDIAVKEKKTAKINFKVNFRRGATGTYAGMLVIDDMLDIE
jgi:hypothetical protein